MQSRSYLKTLTLILAVIILVVGKSFSQENSTLSKKQLRRIEELKQFIPADFNPEKHVLLFQEFAQRNSPERSESVTHKLDKALKEDWPYKYEIVSPQEIFEPGSKYADTSIYKYAILNSLSSNRYAVSTNSRDPQMRVNSIDFCFYDRSAKLKLPYSGESSSFVGLTASHFIKNIKEAKNIK